MMKKILAVLLLAALFAVNAFGLRLLRHCHTRGIWAMG